MIIAAVAAVWLGAAAVSASTAGASAPAATLGSEFIVVDRAAAGGALKADPLAAQTTSFVVIKAESRPDGSWAWTLLPLDVGRLPFKAHYVLNGHPVESPSLSIVVVEPQLPADADINDIKSPQAAKRRIWPWLLAAALLAAAYEGYRRWLARAGASPGAAGAGPPLSPEERAGRALNELAGSGLWERGEHADYYLRLTRILREYLESRWGDPATAMTSGEVARLMKTRGAALRDAAAARELLERADLVKFARLKAGPEEGARDLETVRRVILQTTPAPAAPEGIRA